MYRRRVTALALCAASSVLLAAQQQQTQPPPPTFRSGVSIVPVDVRVVTRDGKPITDLKRSDFTITEDGQPQQIVHFSLQLLEPAARSADDKPEFRKPLGDTLTPQHKRIFLIVLGSGRQVGPVRGVEAATRFVEERLLPQDQVAVLAYNRSTDFTSDHTKVKETLERYWKRHESIESKLRHHFSGLAAIYASRDIPAPIQTEIDAIFRAPGALTARSVDATAIADSAALAADERRNRELIQRAEMVAERPKTDTASPFDQSALDEAALLEGGFDEYVAKSFDTRTDLGNLYAGIRYLRLLDGEKHLVFISPNGLFLPRLENASSIAAFANDARVTIDVVHTYGVAPMHALGARGSVTVSSSFGQSAMTSMSRHIAQLTGGQMMAARAGDTFFRRLDASTRAQYLLGYSPSNPTWDGKYRRIQVKVNRKDAQVLYRHGYAARRETTPLDRQQYLTYSRIASAANVTRNIDDVKVTLNEPSLEGSGEKRVLTATVRMLPGAIKLRQVDGLYAGKVEVVSFSGDRKQNMVGELWQTLEFKLTEENYQKFVREGASYTIRMPLTGEPRYLKTILYDYNADLVGSWTLELKK